MSRGTSHLRRCLPAAGALLLLAAVVFSGCGLYSDLKIATRDMDLDWGNPNPDMNRKIVFTPVADRSVFASEGYDALFEKGLIRAVSEENGALLLLRPQNQQFPEALRTVPETSPGLYDNQALAAAGRSVGATAVVVGSINDISGKEEQRGILLFRENRSFIQFNVGVSAFDMETGAKVYDEVYEGEIEIDEFELEALRKERRIQTPALEEALMEAASVLAERLCERVEALPWKSFVLKEKGLVRIASGSDAGLKKGDLLDLFAPGRKMEGVDGQQFFLPGEKIAKLKVVSVAPGTADAAIVSGTVSVSSGYTVRPSAE